MSGVFRRSEDGVLVVAENFDPALKVACVLGVVSESEFCAKEGSAELGDEFLHRVGFISESTA